MTGGPEDAFQNNAPLDNRIAAWSLAGTRSLGSSHPSLQLSHQVLTSETYGLPINTGATQKPGPTPLGTSLGEPLETINANDSRMNQVVDLNGVLFGGVNTTVTSATGPPRVGIAYFAVGAVGTPFGIFAHILHQGYVAVNGENVLFPSIAVNRFGVGAMAFTLSGPDFFPSAAYVRFALGRAVGPIHITGPGALPEDGFTGYAAFGSPTPAWPAGATTRPPSSRTAPSGWATSSSRTPPGRSSRTGARSCPGSPPRPRTRGGQPPAGPRALDGQDGQALCRRSRLPVTLRCRLLLTRTA